MKPQTKGKKVKRLDKFTKREEIVDTNQNRQNGRAWQIKCSMGSTKGCGQNPQKNQPTCEKGYEKFDLPTGASDDSSMEDVGVPRRSRQTKSKEPQRLGDPVKHSVTDRSFRGRSERWRPRESSTGSV